MKLIALEKRLKSRWSISVK